MDYNGYADELNRLIRKQLNNLADVLANGSAKDYAQYQNIVGQIHGLAQAEEMLQTLRKGYDQEL